MPKNHNKATSEQVVRLEAVSRLENCFDSLYREMDDIQRDIRMLNLKIQFATKYENKLKKVQFELLKELKNSLDHFDDYDTSAKYRLIVGPDFKFHTPEEIAMMKKR